MLHFKPNRCLEAYRFHDFLRVEVSHASLSRAALYLWLRDNFPGLRNGLNTQSNIKAGITEINIINDVRCPLSFHYDDAASLRLDHKR